MKKDWILWLILVIVIVAVVFYSVKPKHVDVDEIRTDVQELSYEEILKNLVGGGPGKDDIPSIDNPKYVTASESNLQDDDVIFGVDYKGLVAAYPQDIMYWHEIVNEEVDGEKVSVTYCPLTGTIIGYKGFELGVSGKLYNSNLVMYDRATDALVPQILGTAVDKEIEGTDIEQIHVFVTTFGEWKKLHPDTKVMTRDTGHFRDYDRTPYPGYEDILRLWFPVAAKSDALSTKEMVLGVENNGEFLAVQKKNFKDKYPEGLETELGGEQIKITLNEDLNELQSDKGDYFELYWFAWYAYHPNTELVK